MLSESAKALLRRRLAGDEQVTDANRTAYRELVTEGVMTPLHSFSRGEEALFRFTEEGWKRRFDLLGERAGTKASA